MPLVNKESRKSEKNAFWLPLSWGVQFTIATTGSVIAWCCQIRFINGVTIPIAGTSGIAILQIVLLFIFSISGIIFPLWAILLLPKILDRIGIWGRFLSIIIMLSFSMWIMNALFKDWFGPQLGGTLRWLILTAFIAAVMLYPLLIMRMKRKAVRFAMLGDYEGALRISRRWLRSKVYGRGFQGWIMLMAGRNCEALELLKDSAFNEKGKAQLKSGHLYSYTLALMSEEKFSEAQPLLEAAVLVPQKLEQYYQFALVECLLSQNKEADRARSLIEQLIAKIMGKSQSAQDRIFCAQCMALHAWALVCCQRREEAEAELKGGLVESAEMDKDGLAGLLNLKGMALQALGDYEMARIAFKEALTLYPYGSIALFARRALAKLGENAHE